MPPCRVTEADLSGVDLLEQLQRLAAVLQQDVRRRSGALDLDVVEGLIVVVVPVGVALLVTDTLLVAIAARGGRRECGKPSSARRRGPSRRWKRNRHVGGVRLL